MSDASTREGELIELAITGMSMPVRDPGDFSRYKGCVTLVAVAACPARWKPAAGTPAEAAAFARTVVAGCGPLPTAKNLLWAAARLACWGISVGLGPVPGVLLHPSVIERFTAHAPGISGAARRTLRTNLRFIARRVVPQLDPADAPLPRERAKQPCSPGEIAGYLALAGAQPTPGRRARAAALVCLGAGAGLIRSDLRNARGTDVCCRSGGVIVEVRGGRAPRAVPVLTRYHAPLLEAAAFAGQQFLTGGTEPERGNITNPLTRSLAGGSGLPALDTSRLRATWLADVAVLPGLPEFMRSAGAQLVVDLRHSFVSLMSTPGVPVEEIARLAGHTSTRTTEVVYRRELRPILTTGAEIMDTIFTRQHRVTERTAADGSLTQP